MPILLEPGNELKVVLNSDKQKGKSKPPYFVFRVLSCRECKKVMDIADSVEDCKRASDAIRKIIEALSMAMVGWGNMKDPKTGVALEFDLALLDDIITLDEARELLGKMNQQGMDEDELKNFDLPLD